MAKILMQQNINSDDAIRRLSNALAILSINEYDKQAVRELVENLLDEKHKNYFDIGLMNNDRKSIMHAIMGALSHYEAEKEKQTNNKRNNTHN